MRVRRWFVRVLEHPICSMTHPVVHRRPWLWLPIPLCPLAHLAFNLDKKWGADAFVVKAEYDCE